jgi:hypothetical protein
MPKPARRSRRRHPLTGAVERALRRADQPGVRPYLTLLDDRLATLSALAAGRPTAAGGLRVSPADRALARRFLSTHRRDWDDGDENLVRGFLDRWTREGEDPVVAAARGLSEAAQALGAVRARPGTLWFFLWELESMLSTLADNPGRPC